MKTSIPTGTCSIQAAVDLDKYLFVGFDGAPCQLGQKALGVCAADTGQGKQAPVDISGILVVRSGPIPFAPGTPMKSDHQGLAIPAIPVAVGATVNTTVGVNVTTTQAEGNVPVTSDAATATLTSAATATAESTADVTLAGSVLPEQVNGWALDGSTGLGCLVRILRA